MAGAMAEMERVIEGASDRLIAEADLSGVAVASNPATVTVAVGQMAGAGALRHAKMFAEYAIWCDGRLVALVCDDHLFLKLTFGVPRRGSPDKVVTDVSPGPAPPAIPTDPAASAGLPENRR